MTIYQDLQSISPDLSAQDLLRHLILERFPGRTLVTASLRAPALVVLKMVADIEPATPVVFCRRGFEFPESCAYRQRIVDLLRLENASQSAGGEIEVLAGDIDHCERMWSETEDGMARSYEICHLNRTLAAYDCWISAVYHMPRPPHVEQRVDVESRLIRVDPLLGWSPEDVRAFMREHDLPFHPRAISRRPEPSAEGQPLPPIYHF